MTTHYSIWLRYPSGPYNAFKYTTREEAQARLDDTLLTMAPDKIDPRWVDAEVVEVAYTL